MARRTLCVTGKSDTLNSLNVNVIRQKDCAFVTGKRKTVDILPINSCVVTYVPFAGGLPQKKGVNFDTRQHQSVKYVKSVSCVHHLMSIQTVTNMGKMGSPGDQYEGHSSHLSRLHSSLPVSAKSDKVTHHHKLLYEYSHETAARWRHYIE